MASCPLCGAEIGPDDEHCPGCGGAVSRHTTGQGDRELSVEPADSQDADGPDRGGEQSPDESKDRGTEASSGDSRDRDGARSSGDEWDRGVRRPSGNRHERGEHPHPIPGMKRGRPRRNVIVGALSMLGGAAGIVGLGRVGLSDGSGDDPAPTTATTTTATTTTATPPAPTAPNRYTESFERESLGDAFERERIEPRYGEVRITDELASQGQRSLEMIAGGDTAPVGLKSRWSFDGEYRASVAANRVEDPLDGATLAFALDDSYQYGSKLALSIGEHSRTPRIPVLSEVDDDGRVMYNRRIGRDQVPSEGWKRIGLTVRERSVTVRAGEIRQQTSTVYDWTSRASHLKLRVLEYGGGITAAFDDLRVRPVDE